jgi:hypothetical protein
MRICNEVLLRACGFFVVELLLTILFFTTGKEKSTEIRYSDVGTVYQIGSLFINMSG